MAQQQVLPSAQCRVGHSRRCRGLRRVAARHLHMGRRRATRRLVRLSRPAEGSGLDRQESSIVRLRRLLVVQRHVLQRHGRNSRRSGSHTYDDSAAESGGKFVGLALDEVNEDDKTDGRIDAWAAQLKNEGVE